MNEIALTVATGDETNAFDRIRRGLIQPSAKLNEAAIVGRADFANHMRIGHAAVLFEGELPRRHAAHNGIGKKPRHRSAGFPEKSSNKMSFPVAVAAIISATMIERKAVPNPTHHHSCGSILSCMGLSMRLLGPLHDRISNP